MCVKSGTCCYGKDYEGGVDALINRSRHAPNIKNRTDDATEQAVIAIAMAPAVINFFMVVTPILNLLNVMYFPVL